MLPIRTIEILIATHPYHLQEIALELRSLVTEVAPNATEKTHSRGLSYYFAERGGPVSAGICQINLRTNHVRLEFIHGAFLPDPQGLLQGAPKYKKHMCLYSFEEVDWDYCRKLIASSAAFDPSTLLS
jgi:hypothetical protein